MVKSLDSSNIISPQDMHQRVLMQKMYSYDKDAKTGLSKAELNKYALDSSFNGSEMPEFAQKLVEKFAEVDQNKDGQLSSTEIASLKNDRGLWSVSPINAGAIPQLSTAPAASPNGGGNALQALTGAQGSGGAADLLSKNIQSLVKKGLSIANNNPQLMTQLENVVHKII